MKSESQGKIKPGDEFLYKSSNKSADPVWLTYVEKLPDDLHRLFLSENPTLEYHIHEEFFQPGDQRVYPKPDLTVRYYAFSRNDLNKELAYNRLLGARGLSQAT